MATPPAVPTPASTTAPPSLIHTLDSILEPVPLTTLFLQRQPVDVELGSGDGSFLVAYATAHPERNFLGVERLLGRLRKTDRRGRRQGLTNLRLLRIEAAYFLEYLLPSQSVAALHVYFPDPWPKRKHTKNRLVNDRFPALAARVLVADGCVHLRTDHADYFEQMRQVFSHHADFAATQTPEELAAYRTDFEEAFRATGSRILRADYRRRRAP